MATTKNPTNLPTPINATAALDAITRRAVEMVEERVARRHEVETKPGLVTAAVGTRQDFRHRQVAVARARQSEQWAAERAANAILRAAAGR